jgi:hypothetical protein
VHWILMTVRGGQLPAGQVPLVEELAGRMSDVMWFQSFSMHPILVSAQFISDLSLKDPIMSKY